MIILYGTCHINKTYKCKKLRLKYLNLNPVENFEKIQAQCIKDMQTTIETKSLFKASFPIHIGCKFMVAITFVKKIHQSCIKTVGVGFFNAGNCTVMQ